MARKDLAGLAALGALGMMMSKKKGADRDTDTGVDVQPSYSQTSTKPSMMADLGEIRDEEGTLSKLRRNTETGEMYDPTGSMSSTSALRPPAKVKTLSRDTDTGVNVQPSYNKNKPLSRDTDTGVDAQPSYGKKSAETPVDVTKLSLAERAKLRSERAKNEGTKTDSRSVNERFRDSLGFKNGGKVSSASKRADGIATKGKTKGTMVMCGGGMSRGKK